MSPPSGADRDAPVRQASLREHNLALVLRQVAGGPPQRSRADVAAATGLTRATVSSLVDELVRGRLIAEIGRPPRPGAGRPATGLELCTRGPAGLGLEINVDYLAASVVDLAGAVRHQATAQVDQRGRDPDEVVASLAGLAAVASAAAAGQDLSIAGAAVAVPGLVRDGVVRLAPNLDWRDVDLGRRLAGALPGVPTTVDNEANLAALGEVRGTESFVYISGEVGIGAGIVLGGELFRGTHGWAGELGHVAVTPDGPLCHCGSRGCLEQYAGQDAILAAAGVPATGTVADIAAAATAGSFRMREALESAGTALGMVISGVVNLLDVSTVVLGGGYAVLAPWLARPVRREIRRRVLTAGWSPVEVRASRLGTEATVVGAAGAVVRGVLDNPGTWLATALPGL